MWTVEGRAARFAPGELALTLGRYNLISRSTWVEEEANGEIRHADPRLQALGEEGVLVTVSGLAMAIAPIERRFGIGRCQDMLRLQWNI